MAVDVQHAVADDIAELNTTINTTPLVDVMLVLLIIFLVTIPVVTNYKQVNLPNYHNIVTVTKPQNIVVIVASNEDMFWNSDKTPIDETTLRDRLVTALRTAAAQHKPFPEVHVRGDKNVRFEAVGRVILACQQAGILKVGFLTEPHNLEPEGN